MTLIQKRIDLVGLVKKDSQGRLYHCLPFHCGHLLHVSNVNHAPGKVIWGLQAEKGRRRWMVIRLKDKDDPDSLLGKQMNLLEKQGEEGKDYYSLVPVLHFTCKDFAPQPKKH